MYDESAGDMNAIPCRQFKGTGSYKSPKKRDEVYVDPVSVELCLDCPLPMDECRGAPRAHSLSTVYKRPTECPYEQAIAARKCKPRTVTLPGPGPDGTMRAWKCEVA